MNKKIKSKSFLRLNLIKILITFLILILAHIQYIGYFETQGKVSNECIGCEPREIVINNPVFWLPYYFIGGGVGDFNPYENHKFLIKEKPLIFEIMFLVTLFYWYVLSCLIFKIFSKKS